MKRVKYHKLVEELRPTFVCQDLFCTEHMAGTSLSMSALSSLTCGEEPSLTILVLFTFHFLISLVPQPTCFFEVRWGPCLLFDQVRDDLHERPVDHHRVDHQAADRVQVHRRRHVGRL